jgi:hypothetical protein
MVRFYYCIKFFYFQLFGLERAGSLFLPKTNGSIHDQKAKKDRGIRKSEPRNTNKGLQKCRKHASASSSCPGCSPGGPRHGISPPVKIILTFNKSNQRIQRSVTAVVCQKNTSKQQRKEKKIIDVS